MVFLSGFQNAGIEDGGLLAGIGPDDQQEITGFDAFDLGVHQVVGPQIGAESGAIPPHLKMIRIEPIEDIFEGGETLHIDQIADDRRDLVPRG